MNYFVVVRTDTCIAEDAIYVINTSIHALVYRIEIYKDEVLVDAIEVNCNKKDNKEVTQQSFTDRYEQAHKEIRNQYCQTISPHLSDTKGKKKENIFFKYITDTNILQKTILSLIGCGIVCYFLITKIFVYSDLYMDTFFSQKEEKMAYLEQVETHTHRLEKECVGLAKKQLNNNIATIKSCRNWCDKRIIGKERCDLFLAYFPKQTNEPEVSVAKDEIVTSYSVLPKEDTVELTLATAFPLKVYNQSNHQIFVILKEILLDNSSYEEIVQFEKAEISFVLKEEEEKEFHIFLEPSYYKQFDLGKYSGSLSFDVKYQDKVIGSIKKQFYFMVK